MKSVVRGLRIVWDPSIDGGAWPGPLVGRSAVVGESWLGPMGLIARLETELGLGGVHAPALVRAAELVSALSRRTGWWRDSYESDPLGTCARLLRDRDQLAMWGWRGEPASDRLQGLWDATHLARPGIPDRMVAIIEALATQRPDIDEVLVCSPPAGLEPLWQQLFASLAKAGIAVHEAPSVSANAAGDLLTARTRDFVPRGDGSLTLLRPHGPLAAADEVAASLAAMDSLDGVVVIGSDEILDAALARHGVPRVGGVARAPGSASLLRLVIEAAFEPMDPAELHAFLCTSPGPIPRRVARPLIGALDRFPGRGSKEWAKAMVEGLAKCDDDWRDKATERASLLMPAARRDGALPVDELTRRLDILAAWARPDHLMIASLAAEARRLLAYEAAPAVSLVRLRRMCDELERTYSAGAIGEAGIAAVDDPGALLAPARVVVWWNFTRHSARTPPRLRLSMSERAALARAGVTPPDIGHLAEGVGARWRRPLELASEALVLVCPSVTESGEQAFPHPLWDELRAAMPDPAQSSVLEARTLVAPRRVVAPRALPTPQTRIQANTPIPLRDRESPSSLEKLLGCSTSYVLHYHAKLRTGLAGGPAAPNPLLYGNLAHHILAEVFGAGALDAEAAATRARAIVDDQLERMCESLALPRYQVERTGLERAIVESARALGSLLAGSGATVRGVEQEHEGTLDGFVLGGKIDLLLAAPDVVIDLKWGSKKYRDKLESGTALQLAVYAGLLGTTGASHEVGYFALQSQDLFAQRGTSLTDARIIDSVPTAETWRGALTVLGERRDQLARGELHAPAATGDEVESRLHGNRLTLAPECGYCGFGGLCGQKVCT